MSHPVEICEEGWTIDQLVYALGEVPADYECRDGKDCDCEAEIKQWRAMRQRLGIWHDVVGHA